MQGAIVLPLLALAACGANAGPGDAMPPEDREYATQTDAPAPNYRAMERPPAGFSYADLNRDGDGSLPADAGALGELWLARLQELDVVDGYGRQGKGGEDPISGFDLRMTAADFDALVAENGWQVPPHLSFSFVPELRHPRVSDAAAGGIRIWPASQARTGLQLEAAAGGRILLRDGCLYLQPSGLEGSEKLAWFHTETGLDIDAEGNYVLVNRISGELVGRLGELFIWAAPNPITPGGPSMAEFRASCGEGEIATVGNPTAESKLGSQYPDRRPPDAMPPPGIE